MGNSILHTHGYINQTTCSDGPDTAFITLADMASIIQAKAPLTGVDVRMATDTTITKALNKDFLLSAFGDQPVSITISGMQITYVPKGCSGAGTKDSVMNFYITNKVSSNITKRIDVGISGGGSTKTFKCALLGMDIQADTQGAEYGFYRYKISLIGVEAGK